jgi:hypothetical protein
MNLRDVYSKQYRVDLDPAADSFADPTLHVIPTRTGEVYPHSDTHAGVEVGRRFRSVHKRLAGYPVHVRGEELTTYLVPWSDLPAVLPVLRPYKQRQVSAEQRQSLIQRTAAHRFAKQDGRGAANPAPESPATASLDLQLVCELPAVGGLDSGHLVQGPPAPSPSRGGPRSRSASCAACGEEA